MPRIVRSLSVSRCPGLIERLVRGCLRERAWWNGCRSVTRRNLEAAEQHCCCAGISGISSGSMEATYICSSLCPNYPQGGPLTSRTRLSEGKKRGGEVVSTAYLPASCGRDRSVLDIQTMTWVCVYIECLIPLAGEHVDDL